MRHIRHALFTFAAVAAAATVTAKPYAVFHTSAGDFVCELFPDKAPKTVENFVGLAKGTKDWQNPSTREVMKGKPLYSGTVFHRCIPGFMIQGGDPLGTGVGGPGYQFEDEFSDLKFDKPGLLAMANRGPATNGSQFFVTVAETPHLNNKHTIFGKVVEGMSVVEKIVNAPGDSRSGRPVNAVTLKSVEIVDSLPGKTGEAQAKSAASASAEKPASDAKDTSASKQ